MADARFEVTVWTDGTQAALVQAILTSMAKDLKAIGVGGPRHEQVSQLADQLGCPCVDDLRKLVVDHPATWLLVTTGSGVGPQQVAVALQQGTTILQLEPVLASFDDLAIVEQALGPGRRAHGDTSAGQRIRTPASLAQAPGWVKAADPLSAVSPVRLIALTDVGPAHDRTLFARLYDAWQFILEISGLPETIDASVAGPMTDVPSQLRRMRGHLAAHARLPDGASCALAVSDESGSAQRHLHLLGDAGSLRADDSSYVLHAADGQRLDAYRAETSCPTLADLIVQDWTGLLERAPGLPVHGAAVDQVLACCLASQLSARTGQAESPATMLQIQQRS